MAESKKNHNITKYIEVTKEELENGTLKDVELEDDVIVKVTIPPKTKNKDTLTVKNLGEPYGKTGKRGDLELVIKQIKEETKEEPAKILIPKVDYDYVIFINSFEAQNGCTKSLIVPPNNRIMLPIKAGIKDGEIFPVILDGSPKKIAVMICNLTVDKLDKLNSNLDIQL